MTNCVKRLSAAYLNSLPPEELEKLIQGMKRHELLRRIDGWETWARDDQWPPEGDWRIWLFLGGRGAGKTRAGAEWIAEGVASGRMHRIALIGATHQDTRSVMIEGESGLLKASEGAKYEPSNARIKWGRRAIAHVLSAEEPDSIRGYQFDAAWCDEFCKWKNPQMALEMAEMALRMGKNPRMLITTTPRNIPALRNLLEMPGLARTTGTTAGNAINLGRGFYEAMVARFGGTRLGRQELDAELIEDNDKALWKREWIEAARTEEAPPLQRIVVAVDPPATSHGDECGIVVAGRAKDRAYVLADRSEAGLTPAMWARRVIDAYEDFAADTVIAEANQGGDMVKAVLANEMEFVPIRLVHATRAKQVRATPAAVLYEKGLVHHAGRFPELEDQLCQYDGTGTSPDRMDALVWALTDLFPPERKADPKVRKI
jgi:phage terminase large subunit-like protein